MLRAAIFDVDGTLVETERDGHRVAFNKAFQEFGLPDSWDEDYYGELLLITGGKERMRHHLSGRGVPESEIEPLVPKLHDRKNEIFMELVKENQFSPRPGSIRFLDELVAAGIEPAVATTGSREWVELLLESLFGLDRFRVLVVGEDVKVKKPDPAAYNIALERLECSVENAIAIEDSRQGLRAAKAANLPCVVVVNDYTHSQDMSAAELVLDGFGEPDAPAKVLSDPLGLEPDGLLTPKIVKRLVAP